MNAQELFIQSGKSAGVYYCSECRRVHRELAQADKCCIQSKCETCGAVCRQYWTICESCSDSKRAADERARFETAEKITAFDGPVYCEGFGRDGFCETVGELLDEIGDGERPEYCTPCNLVPFCIADIGRVLQQIEEDGYEDFEADETSVRGLTELKVACDAFNAANSDVVRWDPDYSRAILLR